MPPLLSHWGHHDLKVLYVLLHDRVEWPLLQDKELQTVPKDERSGKQWRRAKLQELLPGRTWWAILSKLYRIGVTHERLQTILGPHYNAVECEAPTYKDKPKQLAKTWKPWTPEQCEALKTALLRMDEILHKTNKHEVYKRQTVLRESVPKRSWEAVYQKVVRESPTGLGMKDVLHRKLGTKCRGDAKKGLTNPYKVLRKEVRDKLLEARATTRPQNARQTQTCAPSVWCPRAASPEVMAAWEEGCEESVWCSRDASPEATAAWQQGSEAGACDESVWRSRDASPAPAACSSDIELCAQALEAEMWSVLN